MRHNSMECVMEGNQRSEMIIFESHLTTFDASIILLGNMRNSDNLLESKTRGQLRF